MSIAANLTPCTIGNRPLDDRRTGREEVRPPQLAGIFAATADSPMRWRRSSVVLAPEMERLEEQLQLLELFQTVCCCALILDGPDTQLHFIAAPCMAAIGD
jgi:hypothetical protein